MKRHIIFDADHTLIEFDKDEKRAFKKAFATIGQDLSDDELKYMRDYSYRAWAQLGLNDVHTERIQREYHSVYSKYVPILLKGLAEERGLGDKAEELSKIFWKEIYSPSHLIDGAEEVIKKLSEKYEISVASNGLKDMQMGRLEPFGGYVSHYFISEELDCIKPAPEFFKKVLTELKANSEECLMVGDSLSSDIAGANGVGMDSCWFNRFSLPNNSGVKPTYEIKKLEELLNIL